MSRAASTRAVVEKHGDLTLPEGCILCGGPLALRVREGTARTYCATCHWISHPHMRRSGGAVHVIHPAGGVA